MNHSRRRFVTGLGALTAWAASGCTLINSPAGRATVVVVGAGYGGATAAKYLRMLAPDIKVYLVDPSEAYFSCPGSNDVIVNWQSLSALKRSHKGLYMHWGVDLVRDTVVAIDVAKRLVRLASGASLGYDRLVLSPGMDFRWNAIPGYDEAASHLIPHAWKAGTQTELLQRQLQAMPDNGTAVICVPSNPYRCPPGPYERASLIAAYLKQHKPRAKLLVLDAKTQFSKQSLFKEAWRRYYPGRLDWLPYTSTGKLERIDSASRTVYTEFEAIAADVLNVIPPQQAGMLAQQAGLTDSSGWCPIQPESFASTLAADVHIIGDACIANPMPKSAFAASSQAKACALAIAAQLQGRDVPSSTLINTCYSFVTQEEAISVAGVYKTRDGQLTQVAGGETPLTADWRQEARYAQSWRENVRNDSFN